MVDRKQVLAFLWLLSILTLHASAQTIHEAALEGRLERIKAMVDGDPTLVQFRNEDDETALFYAAYGGHGALVEFLIEAGAEVNAASASGETPLHYAAYAGQDDAVRVLIEHGADLGAVNVEKNTPLHYSAFGGKTATARLLVECGASVTARNHYGYTALDRAEAGGHREMRAFFVSQGVVPVEIREPEVVRLSGCLYRVLFPFGDASNMAVSSGSDGLLLVDTGFNRRAMDRLRAALDGMGSGPVRYIINTHRHHDHKACNGIAGEDAVVIDYTNVDSLAAQGVLRRVEIPIAGRTGKTFDVYYTLTFHGEEVRIIPNPGIHTEEDMIVHFSGSGIVHMGDLLISQSFPSVRQKAGEYLSFLEKVIDIFPQETRFVCGHGRECGMEELARYHGMLSSAAEIVQGYLREGKGKREIRADNALEEFERWGGFIPILNADYWMGAVCNAYRDRH